jgi:hypothetical protein
MEPASIVSVPKKLISNILSHVNIKTTDKYNIYEIMSGKLERYGYKEFITIPSLIRNTTNESNNEFNVKQNLKMYSIIYPLIFQPSPHRSSTSAASYPAS